MNIKNKTFYLFFILSALLVHFDPTRLRLTIVIFFIPFFGYKYLTGSFKSYLPFILIATSFLFPIINLLIFNSFEVSFIEFFKTYILYFISALVHIYIIYSPLKNIKFVYSNSITIVLKSILILTMLQFFGSLLFGTTFFYNIFGKFQYNSMADFEELTSGIIPRTQAFFLEPSFLAFVTITLICINLLNNHKVKSTLFLGASIIFMSGSRGGLLGYFLIFSWYFYFSNNNKQLQFRIIYNSILLFFVFIFIMLSPFLTLLSSESLSTENTSQYVRLFSGFQLSNYILSHYIFGVPLGAIEQSFINFIGESNTSYSFFFLNIFYHGWASFLLLIFILLSILLLRIENKYKFLLFIYLLLYFNMTGSLLAPDTYFWFFCFYYAFRINTMNNNPLIKINENFNK